jgi:hypothetical protein
LEFFRRQVDKLAVDDLLRVDAPRWSSYSGIVASHARTALVRYRTQFRPRQRACKERTLPLVERLDQVFSSFGSDDAGTGDVRGRPRVKIVWKNRPAI